MVGEYQHMPIGPNFITYLEMYQAGPVDFLMVYTGHFARGALETGRCTGQSFKKQVITTGAGWAPLVSAYSYYVLPRCTLTYDGTTRRSHLCY